MEFTSLQGHVTATFQELVEAFGAPTYSEPSGDGKVNTEWELILGTDAVRATIYDWKDFDGGRRSRDGQPYDWHIGGKSAQRCSVSIALPVVRFRNFDKGVVRGQSFFRSLFAVVLIF